MKRIFICIALVLATFGVMAQTKTSGIRNEVTKIEGDDNGKEFSIFSYTSKDIPFGYWLGLGEVNNNLGFPFVFEGVTETCIYLGSNSTEVVATLDSLLNCFSLGTDTREFPAMMAVGRPLKHKGMAVCSVERRFIFKRLCIRFTHQGYTTESFLTKSEVKYLRRGFLFNEQKEQNTGM